MLNTTLSMSNLKWNEYMVNIWLIYIWLTIISEIMEWKISEMEWHGRICWYSVLVTVESARPPMGLAPDVSLERPRELEKLTHRPYDGLMRWISLNGGEFQTMDRHSPGKTGKPCQTSEAKFHLSSASKIPPMFGVFGGKSSRFGKRSATQMANSQKWWV